jgi:PAT family beta-lactamase induction signal transducer AmpG
MKPKLPPVWLMGLGNLPFGIYGALLLITIPQLLAARGVPEPQIASVTAVGLIPSFGSFLLAPILDVRFSRRSYAIAFGLLASVIAFFALAQIGNLPALTVLLFAGMTSASLFQGALGGWLGSVVPNEQDGQLAAWFTVGNIGGFGVAAIIAITALRALPDFLGPAVVAMLIAAPLLILALMPPPSTDRRQARESFATLGRDLLALIKQRVVLRTLLIFCLPSSSFALTNTLGGLGGDFHVSEQFVAVVAGTGVTVAAIAAILLTRPLTERIRPQLLYLLIGIVGALFTFMLIALPRNGATFALAMAGENVFQAAAFMAANAIIFRGIGEGSPLAATQFTFLIAAYALPITYMQTIDGHAYAFGGLTTTFLTDAGISLLVCLVLLPFVRRWRNASTP